jgi:hypothetical protein
MGYFSRSITRISLFALFILVITLALVRLYTIVFPVVPGPSASFDCDDDTLAMYRHFQGLGIDATPIIGNLDMEGEKYGECNHVWLLVKSGSREIAYDWGLPRFDSQHYEGYPITLDYLLHAVAQDKVGGNDLAVTDAH